MWVQGIDQIMRLLLDMRHQANHSGPNPKKTLPKSP